MKHGDLAASGLLYTPTDVARLRRVGATTCGGVAYDEELAGPNGMRYVLMKEPGTTLVALEEAVQQLRCDRDVVGAIKVVEIGHEPVMLTSGVEA
jgi:hypothetical protein